MDKNFNLVDSSLFNHPKFGKLQVLIDEKGEPWFVGKEIALALGYAIPQKAILDHVDEHDYKVLNYSNFSKMEKLNLWKDNDRTNKTIINESGVYSLIISSQLLVAREFKHWVTSEVFPSIRKYGHYDIHQPRRLDQTDIYRTMLQMLQANMKLINSLNEEHHLNLKKIEFLTPKADYADKVLNVPDCLTTTQVAKDLGLAAKGLNQLLHDKKVEFCQAGNWHLYSDFQDKGLADYRTYTFGEEDDLHARESLVWTFERAGING